MSTGEGTKAARYLARAGFALTLLFGSIGAAFVIAGVVSKYPMGTAIGTSGPWVVLVAALIVLALKSRRIAPPVFVLLTLFVGARSIAEHAAGLVNRDEDGPLAAIGVLVLGVALGVLGLRRPLLAGGLMLFLGVAQFVAVLGGRADLGTRSESAGVVELLTTSSGVVVVPVLIVGLLFAVGGWIGQDSFRLRPAAEPPAVPTAH